jgi:hypothetical protein
MTQKPLIFSCALLAFMLGSCLCPGQTTNFVPQTKLEAFETNTGTVIIKAAGLVGTVSANNASLAVRCEEITDTGTGRKEQGLVLGIRDASTQLESTLLIDYDEIGSLVNALDFLNKADWSVTTLPSFDAVYTSKGGFRMAAFSSRRNGTIEFAVRNMRFPSAPIVLARDQVAQLRQFITLAKSKLDALGK